MLVEVDLLCQFICENLDLLLSIPSSLGTDLIRIGYVAYHTAVYDSFPLDKYADKRETINKISEYTKYWVGPEILTRNSFYTAITNLKKCMDQIQVHLLFDKAQ